MRKSKKIFNIFMVVISLVCCLGMFTACKKKNDDSTTLVGVTITETMIELEYGSTVYDRQEKKPTVTLKYGEIVIDAKEYSVLYENNTNVGTAKVTVFAVEGSTVLSGSASKEFEITIAELPDISPIEFKVFNDASQPPNVTISGLIQSTDYDLAWQYKELDAEDDAYVELDRDENNFVLKGNYKVTATGKGNYQGTKTAIYTIGNAFGNITLDKIEETYSGISKKPVATIDGLVEGEDYDISYEYKAPDESEFAPYEIVAGKENESFIDAGIYRIIATGKKMYAGEKYALFTIHKAQIPDVSISTGVVYDGSAKRPTYTVASLTENKHFTVAWKYKTFDGEFVDYDASSANSFVNAGEYKIIVTGIGNYTGTDDTIYTIARAEIHATVTKNSYTYNGDKGRVSVSLDINESANTTIYYSKGTHSAISDTDDWAEYSLDLDLDAGVYSLYALVDAITNYNSTTSPIIQFQIAKDELKGLPNLAGTTYVYDGLSHDPKIMISSQLKQSGLVENVDYKLIWKRQYGVGEVVEETYVPDPTKPALNFVNYGVYSVQLYGYGNYTISDRSAINCETYFIINRANMDDFTVQREGYVYGSTPTDFILKGVNGEKGAVKLGATIKYYVQLSGNSNNPWIEITKDTILDAGTYVIRAIASGLENYNDEYTTMKATETNMFTVAEGYLTTGDLVLEIADNDLNALSVDGDEELLEGVTITYYYYLSGSEGSPQVLEQDANLEEGTYKVYAVVSNIKNYNDFTTNVVDYVVEALAQEPEA